MTPGATNGQSRRQRGKGFSVAASAAWDSGWASVVLPFLA